ncbi:hypothetical protein EDD37DRAFT_189074 [Exophiala viscosa]|uniref:uncharacterized protein n=1 Tax=Exophiala viscosa TaxID=2486360 RepID=UPI00218E57B7|nr:hypothetical protein EDD37DRAFT_189074 [Exophiala viscosa]
MQSASQSLNLVEIRSRSPPTPVSAQFSTLHRVVFHHPAYVSTHLLELTAFDGSESRRGIHQQTALLVCGIIVGNTWDEWFTETRNGPWLELDVDALMTGTEYFFHVARPAGKDGGTQSAYRYPVTASFDNWLFPHYNPPHGWIFQDDSASAIHAVPSVSNLSQAIRDRDIRCILSGYQDGLETAYLCPRSENKWSTR